MKTLFMFDIAIVQDIVREKINKVKEQHILFPDQIVELEEWIIARTLHFLLKNNCRLILVDYWPNDLYEIIYSNFSYELEIVVAEAVLHKGRLYPTGSKVKHLISGTTLFLSN